MAERPRLRERWWANTATVIAAVGSLALGACKPSDVLSSGVPDTSRATYEDFGELACYPDGSPREISKQYDFSDRAARAIIVHAVNQRGGLVDGVQIKLAGPESSVATTRQGSGPADIEQGAVYPGRPVVIEGVLPGVIIHAVMPAPDKEIIDVTAECV